MTSLRSLSRWRRELAIFSEEVAAELGSVVARLAPAFDAAASASASVDGELDGFDGIATRGAYERLLPSEWLLHRALPLEFARRAANTEHTFFRLARRQPASPHGSLALFDAGPDQLGVCRVVQLALLVLLTERAERRREAFAWQIVQRLGQPPLQRFDANTVQTFLEARTALRSDARTLNEWRTRFPRQALWLVAGRRLLKQGSAFAAVEVVQSVEPAAEALEVTLAISGRPAQSVQLAPLADSVATRILRDPFRSEAPLAPSLLVRPDANLLLNPQGSRLFYRNQRGELVAVSVPNSPRHVTGNPRIHGVPPGTVVAGVGAHGTRRPKVLYLSCTKGKVVLRSRARWTDRAGLEVSCPAPIGESGELWPLTVFGAELRVVFVAGDRSLWQVDFENQSSKLMGEGVQAVALRAQPSALVAVDRANDVYKVGGPAVLEIGAFRMRRAYTLRQPWQRALLRASYTSNDHFMLGYEAPDLPGLWQLVFFRSDGRSGFQSPQTTLALRAPEGNLVVALDATGDTHMDMGLYVLDADRTELYVIGRSRSKTLVRSTSPIDRVAVATGAGLVAYTTTAGELGFVERSGRTRWRGKLA